MTTYRIATLTVEKLWGYKDISISLFPDVTILIGENGTGKTTLLNLLRSTLTADLPSLSAVPFDVATLRLQGFDDSSTKTIRVTMSPGESIRYRISNRQFRVPFVPPHLPPSVLDRYYRPYQKERKALNRALDGLVPAIWLPVTRRHPVTSDDDDRIYGPAGRPPYADRPPRLGSVDSRLRAVLRELADYRRRLESRISQLYKDFQRDVLQSILYNKQHDTLRAFRYGPPPSQTDQDQLIDVFRETDLLDAKMQRRIRAHFSRAAEALDSLASSAPDIDDYLIIPLIRRTQSLVDWARTLRAEQDNILSPLHEYQETVNQFLREKHIMIDDDGHLHLSYADSRKTSPVRLSRAIDQLSSGEKQILILLTAAVVARDTPMMYVVDEPELSLHISWQKQLLNSLLTLAQDIQIIVATHSPDIVGPFRDNTVNLTDSSYD